MYQATIYIGLFLSILAFVVPRKYFLLPFIVAACFVPMDQRVLIMDLDFTVLRFLVLAGVLRIFIRSEFRSIHWNKFDYVLIAWATCGAVIYIVQWMNMTAVINRSGFLFDAVGLYWLFRQNMRSLDDVKFAFKLLAFSVLLLAPLVAIEWTTGRNPFLYLGKVSTFVREGRYRCQAAFPHSIMLGLFWATLVPVFIGLAISERNKLFYWAAAGASIFIVCGTASSTPVATLLEVLVLLGLFRYRHYGRQIAFGLCALIVVLHIVMRAPVWHLIARANIIGGSTGYHRFHLIDQAIKHFGEWMLLGTRDTSHWGWGLGDVTNQYILEGVRGGTLTLAVFIILLIMTVKTFGGYSLRPMPRRQQWFIWCLCISILGHCLSFVGVSYFGQIMMLLYLTLAIAGLIYEKSREPVVKRIYPALAILR